jgi:predicted ferric reductase
LRSRVRLGADFIGVLALGSVALTVWIWVRQGGLLQTFVYPEHLVSAQALLTGLLAQTLLILQVVCLARVPWLEQGWGHDVLLRIHRVLAYVSFGLMLAHIALFAAGRVGRDDSGGALTALYRLFVSDSWMLLTSLGTLMLVVVMATSIRAARKRFRYESWHLIHLYSYLGLILAFPHQVFTGPHFHQGWTQFFWWAMMCIAFGVTLGFRVLLPMWRTRRHRLRVAETRNEAPGVTAITMTGRALGVKSRLVV